MWSNTTRKTMKLARANLENENDAKLVSPSAIHRCSRFSLTSFLSGPSGMDRERADVVRCREPGRQEQVWREPRVQGHDV